MKSLWVKCLVVVISLMLMSGNAFASLHTDHHEPCPEAAAHARDISSHHDHKAADPGCCCSSDCLTTVALIPENSVALPHVPVPVHYHTRTAYLPDRELVPDPDPPRPITSI